MSTSTVSATPSPVTADYAFTDLLPAQYSAGALRDDVLSGLTGPIKRTSPTWLYDKVGSELFEEITQLPEYYPTRCERQILLRHAARRRALRVPDAHRAGIGLRGEDRAPAGRPVPTAGRRRPAAEVRGTRRQRGRPA
jgi:hypothetical protein